VDQIFDRLEHLFKSWVTPDQDSNYTSKTSSSGDPDVDTAMSELDDFLKGDRASTEAKAKERLAREAAERARAEAAARKASGPPRIVAEAYRTLGLAQGAPMKDVKAAYKKLLLRYHPDSNNGNAAEQKQATDISAHINAAYQTIETWTTTGKVPQD
jgi:hypothetical protein